MPVTGLKTNRSTRRLVISDEVIAEIAALVPAAARTIVLQAGENITLGDLIVVEGGLWYRADWTDATDRFRVHAIAQASIAAGLTGGGFVVRGAPYPARFAAAPASGLNGSRVYLGASGVATLTSPDASDPADDGLVIAEVGVLVGADGATLTPTILFDPEPTLSLFF